MAELYLRKVELIIFPQVGESTKIDELRIKFKCEKTSEGKPNTATVEVFNLSGRTRSILEAKNTRVSLRIGYRDISEVVFIGNVNKCVHKRDKVDIVTSLEVEDGGNRYRNARLEKGYPPGVNVKDVFKDLTESLGLPAGSQEGLPDFKYSKGLALSGLVRDQMHKLAERFKLDWSIQDETLQIIPQDKPTSEENILIDSSSGLVGFPSKTDKGVEFTSLIQTRLRPGRSAKLDSIDLKGVFKIRKVTHSGDSQRGEEFFSKVEASVK